MDEIMGKCDHHPVAIDGSERCSAGSVARPPYTDEWLPAHGCITYTQRCSHCGAERDLNVNQWHVEYGPWGESAADREAARRAKLAEKRSAERAANLDAFHRLATKIVPDGKDAVLVYRRGLGPLDLPTLLTRAQCRDAAEQFDNGDGLVPFYRGLMIAAGWAQK